MTLDEITRYNADWLQAWTDKDVDRLCEIYAEDCVYRDPQATAGLTGREPLRVYLTQIFANTPPMTYIPDEVWPIPGGFCGRWWCEIGEGGALGKLRGFDLVILKGDKIGLNEVYTHALGA